MVYTALPIDGMEMYFLAGKGKLAIHGALQASVSINTPLCLCALVKVLLGEVETR
jgi:hypothetical protein